MKNYILYNKKGKILRTGSCQDESFDLQVQQEGEFIIEGMANDAIQKIIDGKVVDKTLEEIEAEKPMPLPFEQQPAFITNEQWQEILNRLITLEEKRK